MDIAKSRIVTRQAKKESQRKKYVGTAARPRMSVRRTLKNIIVQVIDDAAAKSILQVNSNALGLKAKKSDVAKALGKHVGEKLLALGIDKVVFDRSGYLYHGRVKAVADGARESGLKF